MIAGSVLNLATLSSGHTNNVFHVTPLYAQPGKVATCAADGFLRPADLETGNSRVVVSPEYDDGIAGLFRAGLTSLRSGMCFSHQFLSQNTGLLCSERGLRRFGSGLAIMQLMGLKELGFSTIPKAIVTRLVSWK